MEKIEEVLPPEMGDYDIIAAVSYSASYLGAAIYDQGRATIKLLRDISENEEFSLLSSFFQQEEPTKLLLNKTQDVDFVSFITMYYNNIVTTPDVPVRTTGKEVIDDSEDSEDDETSESGRKPTLIFLPNNAFNYESGLTRITELFSGECFNETENSLVTRFRIDFSSRNMVSALGALLKYLDITRVGVEFEPLTVHTPVKAIKSVVVAQMVEMDRDTFRSLDIFPDKKQRSFQKCYRRGSSSVAATASLFGVCNKCKSSVGTNTLRKWFENPTTNQDILKGRQQAISFFLQDCNMDITGKIYGLLGTMKNVRQILRRLRAGTAKVVHWQSLYKMISSGVYIGRFLKALNTPLNLLDGEMECFGDTLAETMAVLSAMVDFPESHLENRLVVNFGVDPELDREKELYRRLPGILTKVAQEESDRLCVDTCSVAYVPMIGYLLSIPHNFDVSQFQDLQVVYTGGDCMNIKSDRMKKLDEELGDVKMKIIDKETTISLRMSSLMLSRGSILLNLERVGRMLDATISLALTAKQLG
ncbi:hypothetical protein Q1695_013644 [Nippostrongylus brasiliensis]|nr:hypothetical protein Q1695_013644 [Nippostrongylus brasiliensis]